jgi:hypothetical protein
MNLLDMIAGYQQDNPNPSPVLPPETYGAGGPEMMSPGAAATGVPPGILELLAQIKTPEVQMPQADSRAALTPALFQFAQSVTAPRRRGQSSGNAILSALNQGMNTYTKGRDAMQDRAIQQEVMKRKLQESELGMQRDKLSIVSSGQQIEERGKQAGREQEKHDAWKEQLPQELERARVLLENAKTDGEVKRADLIIKNAKTKYADQLAKAELDFKNAQTTKERAAAELKADQAKFWLEKALFHEQEIAAKAKRQEQRFKAEFKEGDVVVGRPNRWIKDNKYYIASHTPTEAVELAKKDATARVEMGDFRSGSQEYRDFLREQAAMYQRGDKLPVEVTDGDPKSSAPKGAPAQPTGNGDGEKSRESLSKPGIAFGDPDDPNVAWLNGRKITMEEAKRLMAKKTKEPQIPNSPGSSMNQELGM